MDRITSRHLIQLPGWLLLAYLFYAQAIPAFNYDLGVRMGTQESAATITQVGTAFWYGFAFADLVVYIPLLAAGLIGHWKQTGWHPTVLGAALGISIYWPVASLASVVAAQDAPGWHLTDLTAYWIVLPAIALWAAWALWQLLPGRR
ncbi:MAG: hypothetical protein OEM63_00575 [Gammaproteobacteria bacterium]|nr:hypothetical protein [Gammaproteobacteria bacterium]